MKIYTKTGDSGKTSLIGGKKVDKCCDRLESYGTIDELNAHIGLVFDTCNDEQVRGVLANVQRNLFTVGAQLACEDAEKFRLSTIDAQQIELLEQTIDNYTANLPQLKDFILPAGYAVATQCHVARTVCRRAERCIIKLNETEAVDANIRIYINRLSDFLFVLSRKIMNDHGFAEVTWSAK
jgi:cob(I)alamin adenosyltransferase